MSYANQYQKEFSQNIIALFFDIDYFLFQWISRLLLTKGRQLSKLGYVRLFLGLAERHSCTDGTTVTLRKLRIDATLQ